MKIQVNGTQMDTGCATLDELLTELNYPQTTVATAVEGQFVGNGQRSTTLLQEGMTIDVVAPMQGG